MFYHPIKVIKFKNPEEIKTCKPIQPLENSEEEMSQQRMAFNYLQNLGKELRNDDMMICLSLNKIYSSYKSYQTQEEIDDEPKTPTLRKH